MGFSFFTLDLLNVELAQLFLDVVKSIFGYFVKDPKFCQALLLDFLSGLAVDLRFFHSPNGCSSLCFILAESRPLNREVLMLRTIRRAGAFATQLVQAVNVLRGFRETWLANALSGPNELEDSQGIDLKPVGVEPVGFSGSPIFPRRLAMLDALLALDYPLFSVLQFAIHLFPVMLTAQATAWLVLIFQIKGFADPTIRLVDLFCVEEVPKHVFLGQAGGCGALSAKA